MSGRGKLYLVCKQCSRSVSTSCVYLVCGALIDNSGNAITIDHISQNISPLDFLSHDASSSADWLSKG